jgi:hypothetical protein
MADVVHEAEIALAQASRSEVVGAPSRSFQIVPLRGLPVVAVVLAGLVAAIAPTGCGPSTSSTSSAGGFGRRSTSSSGS